MCPERDSNSHALRHTALNRACLPVSPSGHDKLVTCLPRSSAVGRWYWGLPIPPPELIQIDKDQRLYPRFYFQALLVLMNHSLRLAKRSAGIAMPKSSNLLTFLSKG